MSILNMTTNTSRNIKDVSLALVLIGSLVGVLSVSTSVHAAPASSIEEAVSKLIVVQSKNMMTELNTQIQQSINDEIKTFSTNFSLNTTAVKLSAEQEVKKAVENTVKKQKDTNNNQTK